MSSGTTAFVADVAAVNAAGARRDVLLQSADDLGASARDSGASADLPGARLALRLSALVCAEEAARAEWRCSRRTLTLHGALA